MVAHMLAAVARHSGQTKFWMGHVPPAVAAIHNTTSILRLKAYIFFRKSKKIKFDLIFRKIY
jgi:hypothetical protein